MSLLIPNQPWEVSILVFIYPRGLEAERYKMVLSGSPRLEEESLLFLPLFFSLSHSFRFSFSLPSSFPPFHPFFSSSFIFFLVLLTAVPVAYGSSQAKGRIGAAAAAYATATATQDLSGIYDLQLMAMLGP